MLSPSTKAALSVSMWVRPMMNASANPLGSARYTRIDGIDGVPLLPAYVAETWEQAIGGTVPR